MRLATNKCIALRITNKTNHEATSVDRYMLGNEHLNWCTEVRDLGVLVDHKLLFNQHIANIIHKARVRARLIIRSFCSKDSSVLIKAFVTYVRPMLEYCSSIWSPFTNANVNKLEAVQRNFTKHVAGLSDCGYCDRLFNLHLESLELNRIKCDLTAVYKLIHGHFDIRADDFIQFVALDTTRGHQYKIYKQLCSVNVFKYSFPNRCIEIWNSLPADVVNAVSTRDFKRQLDNVDLSRYCSFLFNRLMFNYCFIGNGTPSFYAPPHNCLFKGVCEWLCPVHPGNDLPIKKQ
jgi:hypothetical protein